MRWATCWQLLLLLTQVLAQRAVPTACEEDACRCDSFTRLICNCTREFNELTLRPDGAYRVPPRATSIIINGCERVIFLSQTIRNLIQLRTIELRNIENMMISERALTWSPFPQDNEVNPGIKITIINSTLTEISSHAIQGQINDIVIRDSRIINLKPFAFSSLTGVKNIELSNNVYDKIEIQALKKFTTENFILKGGNARSLPSRFLSDVEVINLLRMEGMTIKLLSSLAFLVSSPKRVLIESNIIETLEGDSFHITSKGPITFRNNTVSSVSKGAFLGLAVDAEILSVLGRQEILIDNNTMTSVNPFSLLYNETSLSLRIDGLNLNTQCSCQLAEEWQVVLSHQKGIINCWYQLEAHYMSLPTFVNSRCGSFKETFWIFVVVGVLIVIMIAVILIFFIVRRENEKKKKMNVVMPDGKTYRETEFHIVVERAELITTDL